MLKKSTSPPSRAERMLAISVPGTLAQLTTRSNSPRVCAYTSSALVASATSHASASPSEASRFAASGRKSSAVTCAPFFRACAQAREPLLPAPSTSTRWPRWARRATHAGAPQTSRTASASASGRSSGNGAHRPVENSTARPRTSRRSACACTARISSRTSGVSVRDTRVAIRSPRSTSPRAGCSAPTSATRPISIPPEPVTGFCSFPRAATISRTRAAIREVSPPHSWESCRKEAASTFKCSTSMESSSGPSGRRGSMTSACCGSTPFGRTTRRSPYGSATRGPGRRPLLRELLPGHALRELDQRGQQVDRYREDGGAGFFGADLDQRLQIAQLQRGGMCVDHVRRHPQLLRRLVLALRRDHLRAPLALGLRLPGHRALHLGRQIDGLHLHRRHLDSPGLGVQVEHLLKLLVDLLSLGEQVVEIQLAQRAAQRGLRELGGGVEEVLDLDDGLLRVDHAEVDHRGHLQADVVVGDHVLRRHVPRDGAEVDLHHPVHPRHDPIEPCPLRLGEATEPEDDPGLVLLDHPQAGDDPDQHRNDEDPVDHEVAFVSAAPSGTTSRVSPWTARTRARAPGSSGWALAAFHSSPATSTMLFSRTSPTSPISEYPPARSGWRALAESFQASVPAITAIAAPTGATIRQPRPKSASA